MIFSVSNSFVVYHSIFPLSTYSYEDIELFKEIEPADLDYLGIVNQEHRAKLLTAVQLLHDVECKFVFYILF